MCRIRWTNGRYDYVKRDRLLELMLLGQIMEVLTI